MTANDGFFREQESPAVLKHGILKRYPDVFASAAGSRAGRVVLLDGYAGRGEYEDGTPGSPRLLLESAGRTAGFRNVECVFVERKRSYFENLEAVVATHGGGLAFRALRGDLSTHLPDILAGATDAALFAFLDPFGTALEFDELCDQLLARPAHPPTEVLLHVSVGALRRIAGLLRSLDGEPTDPVRKTIERVDRFLGGTWWHEIALGADDGEGVATLIAEQLIGMYCQRVRDKCKFGSFMFPIRSRPELATDYFLVLFSRNGYGMWRFNDSLSSARKEWQEHWRGKVNVAAQDKAQRARDAEAAAGLMSLFGEEDPTVATAAPAVEPYDEASEEKRWGAVIEANLRALFAAGVPFKPMDRMGAIYGEVLGEAREKHVAQAVKRLYAVGVTTDPGTSNGFSRRLMHPGPNAASGA